MSVLVVGSRGSMLALRQCQQTVDELERRNPGLSCRIEIIKTIGDSITDVPLAKIGDKGLFVKEIELALLSGEIDFAVHSAKDLPSKMDEALCIAAYPERANPFDALISKHGVLSELPPGSIIGTSSVRRRAQILHVRPDVQIADLRGNLDTRLNKLDNDKYDAIILACAGLHRMGWNDRVTEILNPDICLPAVGQGALAVQCRSNDSVIEILRTLDHYPTRCFVSAERALLALLDAGCQTPVAALAQESDGKIRLDALVCALDGSSVIRRSGYGNFSDSEDLGIRLGNDLLNSPAKDILDEVRRSNGPKGMGAA